MRPLDEAKILSCDRYPEFDLVKRSYVERRHQLLIVAGPKHEAHEYFVARMEEQLAGTPPYKPVRVTWRPSANLRRGISRTTGPCRRRRRHHRASRGGCLGVIAEAKPALQLKCVLPIAWQVSRLISSSALSDG
jgi:hypothetical protein